MGNKKCKTQNAKSKDQNLNQSSKTTKKFKSQISKRKWQIYMVNVKTF